MERVSHIRSESIGVEHLGNQMDNAPSLDELANNVIGEIKVRQRRLYKYLRNKYNESRYTKRELDQSYFWGASVAYILLEENSNLPNFKKTKFSQDDIELHQVNLRDYGADTINSKMHWVVSDLMEGSTGLTKLMLDWYKFVNSKGKRNKSFKTGFTDVFLIINSRIDREYDPRAWNSDIKPY